MTTCSQIVLMASYNEWMNAKLYAAAAKLTPQELAADRKAFFRSIIGTLNHIVVGDTIWLKRFATHPSNHAVLESIRKMRSPATLDELAFTELGALFEHRIILDETIKQWATTLTQEEKICRTFYLTST